MRKSGLSLRVAISVILIFSLSELSAATFTVSGSTSGGGRYLEQEFGAGPSDQLERMVQDGGLLFSSDSLARAGTTNVGVYAGLTTIPDSLDAFAGIKSSTAVSTSSVEFTITPPQNYAGGLIPISFSFDVDAILSVALESDDSFVRYRATSSLRVSAGINAVSPLQTYVSEVVVSTSDFGAQDKVDGLLIQERISSGEWMIDPTVINSAILSLDARSFIDDFGALTATAISDAYNSLTLPLNEAIFVLPEGFTINSADANIVDNVIVSPVPIPSVFGIFASICFFLIQKARPPVNAR